MGDPPPQAPVAAAKLPTLLQECKGAFLNPRARKEAAWVLGHKLAEFIVIFVGLKLLTNLLRQDAFAEFNLALTATMLLGNLTLTPVNEAYLRYMYPAEAAGTGRAAGFTLLRWNAVATIGVAVLAALTTEWCGRWFTVGRWTGLAAGLLFLVNRWRSIIIQWLDARRERKACAVQNVGFMALQTAAVALAAWKYPTSAAMALLAYAFASAVFTAVGGPSLLRYIFSQPPCAQSELPSRILSFGVPFGLLLTCQWVQGFAERYILAIRLPMETVGVYIAAYQVCGIPSMLFSAVFNGLALPVAYQRSKSADNAKELWSADKVLLLALGAYVAAGAAALVPYVLWGPELLRMLTHSGFQLSTGVIVMLAAARFLQGMGLVLQSFFAVHQRMGASLGFRAIGGLLVVPICWFTIEAGGVQGAALGILLSCVLYTIMVCIGPGGCIRLVTKVRSELSEAVPPETIESASSE